MIKFMREYIWCDGHTAYDVVYMSGRVRTFCYDDTLPKTVQKWFEEHKDYGKEQYDPVYKRVEVIYGGD